MSNFFQMIRKEEDGSYILAVPVSPEQAKVPLIDNNADTGMSIDIRNFYSDTWR